MINASDKFVRLNEGIFHYIGVQIVLLVGTKLELVIMEMAQQIQDRTTIVRGAPVVQPSNEFFWFNRPQWILFLIHFTLFQVFNYLYVWINNFSLSEEYVELVLDFWLSCAERVPDCILSIYFGK